VVIHLLLAQTLVTGVVTGDSARPLAGAIVEIASVGRRATANARGAYTLVIDHAGAYSIEARAMGFSSSVRAVRLGSGDTLRLDFALSPVPQELAPVVVTVEEALPTERMRGFEERRRLGFGRFITRDMLDQREHDTVSGILRGMAGVRMVRRPTACGDGYSAATGRGIASVGLSQATASATCGGGTPLPAACYMVIYVDGVRLWAPGTPDPPDFEHMRNNNYEGVEVYRGPSELPIQYQGTGAACGAILLWTRVGG
jgi:hypothetical protein